MQCNSRTYVTKFHKYFKSYLIGSTECTSCVWDEKRYRFYYRESCRARRVFVLKVLPDFKSVRYPVPKVQCTIRSQGVEIINRSSTRQRSVLGRCDVTVPRRC